MLAFADAGMSDDILKIWQDAFPEDRPEDARRFLSKFLSPDKCAVWLEGGKPVSMTFMLPAKLVVNGQPCLNLIYIYAAATLSAYRGRGIFGRLLTQVHEYLKASNIDATFLHPAEDGLYGYYKRFGYQEYFKVCTETVAADRLQGMAYEKPEKIYKYSPETRNGLLESFPVWVEWPEELVFLAAENALQAGGEVVTIPGGEAVCEPFEGRVFIREWLCRPEYEDMLLNAVNSRFPGREILLRRPVKPDEECKGEKFGMICPLNLKAGDIVRDTANYSPYMGFAFD
ncbi:MAG TPA: GNAT family N-acetyltransferase [Clostridiales bacterium]|nr:GNAT family N-acetyltransferase [Clostridiales bacterium]